VARPAYEVDYRTLEKLCQIQCTKEECAAVLGVDADTLHAALKRDGYGGFSEYFNQKSAFGKASLRRSQYQAAEKGNPTMLIWLGKQWLGQSDQIRQEVDLNERRTLKDYFDNSVSKPDDELD